VLGLGIREYSVLALPKTLRNPCTSQEAGLSTFIFTLSLTVLIGAYASEMMLHLRPCNLCLWQRLPYALASILSLTILCLPPKSIWKCRLIHVCGLVFLASTMLALYHVGIEEGWLEVPASCSNHLPTNISTDALLSHISHARPSCRTPQMVLLGLSMAAWNAILSMIITVIIFSYRASHHALSRRSF
jgi:disulfide bond formation protein DsbB